jgi:hypothetical protein
MFTGLVRVTAHLQRSATGVRIRGDLAALGPVQLGDSIAVDGVCLTVASLEPDGFRADVSEETLGRSSLAARALAAHPTLYQAWEDKKVRELLNNNDLSGFIDHPKVRAVLADEVLQKEAEKVDLTKVIDRALLTPKK